MPKMKTKRAAAKRFSKTATGKFRRRRAGLRHILTKKDRKTKKIAGSPELVNAADVGRVKDMLPYA